MTESAFLRPDWVAADHHFGHANIRKFEPELRGHFETVEHMNEVIVARHNEVVGPDDVFVALGDLAMGPFEETLKWVARMNGRKFLVPGNHDRVHPIMSKSQEKRDRFQALYEAAGFTILPLETEMWFGDTLTRVSHFPYRGTEGGDHSEKGERHPEWRPEPSEQPLVHGHIHQLRQAQDNMFNVGLALTDLAPTPASRIVTWLGTL